MLIIGSQAAKHWNLLQEGQVPRDTDIICTFEEFKIECARIKEQEGISRCVPLSKNKFHVRNSAGWNYEFEVAWPDSSGEDLLLVEDAVGSKVYASPQTLLALKLSHRYLRNSPHFLKTMRSIQHFRQCGINLSEGDSFWYRWLPKRERETYVYKHPKLDVSKGEFFDDSVPYVYDHDSIHETVALIDNGDPVHHRRKLIPAYTHYMQDGAAVMTDKEQFFAQRWEIRLYGVYEEACVLALERSQIPHNFVPAARYSFELALMKVCTSITSGWFREYAWENYDKVLDLYAELGENNYIERFKRNAHLLQPFEGGYK
ncbi:hypothetical protein D3C85_566430 [compost metagenome]